MSIVAIIILAVAIPLSIVVCFVEKFRNRHYDPEHDIHDDPVFQSL